MAGEIHANIAKIGNGYILTIKGSGRDRFLVITQDGAMLNTSMVPIDEGDMDVARRMLPEVEGGAQVGQLHQGLLNEPMKAVLRRWTRAIQ